MAINSLLFKKNILNKIKLRRKKSKIISYNRVSKRITHVRLRSLQGKYFYKSLKPI